MFSLESTLVMTVTLVLLFALLLAAPALYGSLVTCARLEVINNTAGQVKGISYRVVEVFVGDQKAPCLISSPEEILRAAQFVDETVRGIWRALR